ncbi:OprO/OprP family phosphate-selective porin [Luteimonas pelagia]
MNLTPRRLTLALLAAALAPIAHAEVAIHESDDFSIGFEGMVQTDAYWYDSDLADLDGDAGDGDDADFGLRRSELVLSGGIHGFDWVAGYDMTGEKWLDVNLARSFGAHTFRVGQFKQPNSMEELSSTKNNDFISKAMVTNTFGVSRRLGASYGYAEGPWTATASWFGRELTDGGARGAGYGLRGTFAPDVGEGNLAHVGVSYVDYDTANDSARLRTRPQADQAGIRLVDTGTLADADRISTIGLEGMWATGPVKLQGEVMRSTIDRYNAGDFGAEGAYLAALWNVTGESFAYKPGVPATPKAENPSLGLWQLGVRYDTIDLDDGLVEGGEMDAVTVGVNWYWQKNFKFMLNYVDVSSDRRRLSDDPDILEARAQFYW